MLSISHRSVCLVLSEAELKAGVSGSGLVWNVDLKVFMNSAVPHDPIETCLLQPS